MNKTIPFNVPHLTGRESSYITEAQINGKLSGDGPFTKKCHQWLEQNTACRKALLTQSCTAALEMSALLMNLEPGDEVIMPSYTFVSTANAYVLRGAIPVFVDIRTDTLNLDEQLIESAITPRTKAIVPVHYAGVACEMDTIMDIAKRHELNVVEDAAQGVMAKYKGRALGALGHMGTYSFHETKNIISGEGGALLINDDEFLNRAEIIREKGTDRSRFVRGQVDKYTWQEAGSSFLPSELTAAFLMAQLEAATAITEQRLTLWNIYHQLLESLEKQGKLRRPIIPAECEHNAHMYYVLLPEHIECQSIMDTLKAQGISAVFHYVPLHDSPGGLRYAKTHGSLTNTMHLSQQLIRLPFWIGLTTQQQEFIVEVLTSALLKS